MKEYLFQCYKCSHYLIVEKPRLDLLVGFDCPECGEEWGGNWRFKGIRKTTKKELGLEGAE